MVVLRCSILSLRVVVSFLTLSSSLATVLRCDVIQTCDSDWVFVAVLSKFDSFLSLVFLKSVSVSKTFLRLPFFTASYSILTSISRNLLSFYSSSFLRASFFAFYDSNCLNLWCDSLRASVILLFYCCLMLTVSFCLASEILFDSSPYLSKLLTWSLWSW